MKKNNKDVLKKHHFWILFGLVPLLVLIAVLMVSSNVGGEIATKTAEITAAESAIKSKSNPKPDVLIAKMGDTIKVVDSKQDDLWKRSYAPQKTLFTMLDSPKLKAIERLGLKFGDKIPDIEDAYAEFKKKDVYQVQYTKMAERVAPTVFSGGWEKILRHIDKSAWTDVKLTSEQIWLLLEDVWVQESLLEAVNSVNTQMAEFSRVKFERDGQVIDDPADKAREDPLRRKFKSRTWEIELEVVQEGTKQILKGRLINTTDKLQLMGVDNTMTLKVWLEPGNKKNVVPFEFKIGGEFLPGEGATKLAKDKGRDQIVPANVLEIVQSPDHVIPLGMKVSEITSVEQVFDNRTVPIRVIESLALGFQDSRISELPLKAPKFFPEEPASTTGPAATSIPGAQSNVPPPGGKAGPGDKPIGPIGAKGPGGPGQESTQRLSGGGSVASVIDANKKRYIEITDQVRRMPIGMAVIVDQTYLQDILLALANSPLRFQITQVTWNRYRGSLDTGSESGGTPGNFASRGGSSGVVMGGMGQFGKEFASPSDIRAPKRPGPGVMTEGPGMPRPGPGGPGFPAAGFGMSGNLSTVSEAQLTSGLIELQVYGVVSLYTSPEAAVPDPNADPKKDKEPGAKGKEPGQKDPMPGKESGQKDKEPGQKEDPMPKAPMTPDPKKPKMRVRRGQRIRN